MAAASAGEVLASGDRQPGAERLNNDRHEARQHDHPDELVAEQRASPSARRPIPRIHTVYRHEIS